MKYVENITILGQFSEPEKFHIAHLFPCVWKIVIIILIMIILLAEHKFFPSITVQRQTYIPLGLTPNNSKFLPERIPASNNVFLEYTKIIFSFISAKLTS